jgi:FKBP-type peptidyl-prolyl cis-trans isomerase (trigger factor)
MGKGKRGGIAERSIGSIVQNEPSNFGLVENRPALFDTKARLPPQGMALKDLTSPRETSRTREMAQKQVRTFLILEKIAAQEGIAVSDEEVEGRLKEISERGQQKFDAVKRSYEKNGLIPEIKGGILTEKTLSFLLEKANVKYL